MKTYFTGLIPCSGQRLRACKGRGWAAFTGQARAELRHHISPPGREVILKAGNAGTAQKALDLILVAHSLINGAPGVFSNPYSFRIVPKDPKEYRELFSDPVLDTAPSLQMDGFPEACRLAAKASRTRAHCYALALYQLSQSIHFNHPMDLHAELTSEETRSPIPQDHVRFAYSVISAYAVLEQLGLSLQGEAFKDGKWIIEKRSELEGRLNAVGLDLRQPAIWSLRGGRTSLERRRKTQAIGKAKWAYGSVRDEEVAIVDAIADLRWLRSGVAAHDVKDLARLLSVFDVANAQWLARRCLLACLRGGESPVK